MGLFTTLKEAALTAALRHQFKKRLERYATMPRLQLKLSERRVEGEILLRGEQAPILFSADFQLFENPAPASQDPGRPTLPAGAAAGGPAAAAGPSIILSKITLSREWMQRLAEDFVADRPFPLPPDAAKWLRRLGEL